MSKTKEMFMEQQEKEPIDVNRYIDDEFFYEKYLQEEKRDVGDPPVISDCCEAPIFFFEENICKKCLQPCNPKE
jgi:hypothetical protein